MSSHFVAFLFAVCDNSRISLTDMISVLHLLLNKDFKRFLLPDGDSSYGNC